MVAVHRDVFGGCYIRANHTMVGNWDVGENLTAFVTDARVAAVTS